MRREKTAQRKETRRPGEFSLVRWPRGVDRSTFERNLGKMRRIYMKSITVPRSCKEIKELDNKLNTGSQVAFILRPGGS